MRKRVAIRALILINVGANISRTNGFQLPSHRSKGETCRLWGSSDDLFVASSSQRIGFVGCGVIAHSIASGLLGYRNGRLIQTMAVSRRSESKSSQLARENPEIVTVYEGNQAVLENSDLVFMCVLPTQLESVMSELTFCPETHTLVSLVSTSNLRGLAKMSGLPPDKVFKMICLPRVAQGQSTSLIVPQGCNALKLICSALGGFIECDDEESMRKLTVTTSLMGPLYGIMKRNVHWLIKHGIHPKDASHFVSDTYLGIVHDAKMRCEEEDFLDLLIQEQTQGGLNEQALSILQNMGVLDAFDTAMDAIKDRLDGKDLR